MSHFYGSVKGRAGEASRLGNKGSGMVAVAAGWKGAIETNVFYDPQDGKDKYQVVLKPWQGSGGMASVIAEGVLDALEN